MTRDTESFTLRVENLRKDYDSRGVAKHRQKVRAVDGVRFTLGTGEVLGIIGESGCGKSTLARLLLGLEAPTDGSIFYNEQEAVQLLKKQRLAFRRLVQMVFQNPFDTFPPGQTIEKILTRVLAIHHIGANGKERLGLCEQALESGGLCPAKDFLCRYPHELSGGQLQRVSILRAMLLQPRLIVADEPVSMLDVSVRAEIINTLLDLSAKQHTAMIFISHDLVTTRFLSNRVAVMYGGNFVETGLTEEVLQNPAHPYTKELLAGCLSADSIVETIPGKSVLFEERLGCCFASRCPVATGRCFREHPQTREVGNGHSVRCFLSSCKSGRETV